MLSADSFGMSNKDQPKSQDCLLCVLGEWTKAKCTGKLIMGSGTGSISTDICGPMKVTSNSGTKYFLRMMIAGKRYVSVHFLKIRKDVKVYYYNYINWVERHTNMKVGRIDTKNATKFILMDAELNNISIALTKSSTHTPQFIGIAERMNRTLFEKARSIIENSGLNEGFCWAESFRHVADLHKRTVTLELKINTPTEALLGTTPDN